MTFGPLVSPEWLREHLGEPGLVVVDIRWQLGQQPGDALRGYLAGHIPGAVFADLDGDISGHDGPGRHPLPTRERFEAEMQRLGVNNDDRVIAYDDAGGSIAARLWFLLRRHGHPEVAVLDGALAGWGEPREAGEVSRPPGDFAAAQAPPDQILDFEDVGALRDAALLDARAYERYTGEVEPTGVRAGHIPGARSAYWAGNLRPDGRFKSPAELRERFRELGVEDSNAVVYCGSGVTSCHDLLALDIAGFPGARLYEGSYGDWANRPEAPVRTGSDP